MTWKDVTVEQYQALFPILSDNSLDNFDKEVQAITSLARISEEAMNKMPYEDYLKLRGDYQFLHTGKIEGNAVRSIKVGKNSYKVMYDLKKLPIARYVEVKHFAAETFIANLHLLAASIVCPEHTEYSPKDHSKYAEDMKRASFCDVYHTALFFCLLYARTISLIPDYLVSRIMQMEKISQQEAQQRVKSLCEDMAGFTM